MKNGAKKKFNKKSLIAVILCAVIVFGIVSYDFISGRSSCEKTSVAMGTVVTFNLYGFGAKNDLDKIETEINGLEKSVLSWRKKKAPTFTESTKVQVLLFPFLPIQPKSSGSASTSRTIAAAFLT